MTDHSDPALPSKAQTKLLPCPHCRAAPEVEKIEPWKKAWGPQPWHVGCYRGGANEHYIGANGDTRDEAIENYHREVAALFHPALETARDRACETTPGTESSAGVTGDLSVRDAAFEAVARRIDTRLNEMAFDIAACDNSSLRAEWGCAADELATLRDTIRGLKAPLFGSPGRPLSAEQPPLSQEPATSELSAKLKELSDKATKGEWKLERHFGGDYFGNLVAYLGEKDGLRQIRTIDCLRRGVSKDEMEATGEFICLLVNLYRSGELTAHGNHALHSQNVEAQPPQGTEGMTEEMRERVIQELINQQPDPVRHLSERLADILDADHWNNIEPLLLDIAARLTSAKTGEWQPIETAPKAPGVYLLGLYGTRRTMIGWSDRWERWTDLGPKADLNAQPECWMPLSAPPSGAR